MDKIITNFLHQNNIFYQLFEHDPIFTMQDTKNIPGLSLEEGVKSLLLKADDSFVLFVLPGIKRMDSKKIKVLLKTRDLRFATAIEVKNVLQCEIGSCFPFGNLIPVSMYVDKSLLKSKIISFTPGIHTKSIRMRWKDYQKYVHPKLAELSE